MIQNEKNTDLKMPKNYQKEEWVKFFGRRISRDSRTGYILAALAFIFCVGGFMAAMSPIPVTTAFHEMIYASMAYMSISMFVSAGMFFYIGNKIETSDKAERGDLNYFSWKKACESESYYSAYNAAKFKRELEKTTLQDRIDHLYYTIKAEVKSFFKLC